MGWKDLKTALHRCSWHEGTFLKPREHRNTEECRLATPVSSFRASGAGERVQSQSLPSGWCGEGDTPPELNLLETTPLDAGETRKN